MSFQPVVRYMILCRDWGADPDHPRSINIYGLHSNIRSLEDPPYPLLFREICVFLALTDCRGKGTGQIVVESETSGQRVFSTQLFPVTFGADPLDIVGVPIRIQDCEFPSSGLYLVQFWYNGEMLEERPLRLR